MDKENKEDLPKNVFRHDNGMLWVNKRHQGKRLRESLRTKNVPLAKARAAEKIKKFIAGIESGKWDSLDKTRSKRTVATVGQVVDLFEEFAALQGMAHSTVVTYKAKLRRVIQKMVSKDWLKVSTAELTPELCNLFVERWMIERVDAIKDDPRKRQATVNMAQGELRNAAAVFSRSARGYYRDRKLKLPPEIGEFGPSTRYKAKILKYRLPDGELIRSTLEAGHELTGVQWLIFAGCFELACRGDDLASARVDWFLEDARGQWWLEVPEEETKGKRTHRKRVPTALKDRMLAEIGEREFVLPGDSLRDRLALVQRGKFPAWMRSLGWETAELAHELRKLRGCYVYHHFAGENSPLEAKKLLGHGSISTTENYYADNLGIPIELHELFTRWDDVPVAAVEIQIKA